MRIVRVFLVGQIEYAKHAESDWMIGIAVVSIGTIIAAIRIRTESSTFMSGADRCLGCKYDLAGLESPGDCPECARPFPTPRTLVTDWRFGFDHRRTPALLLVWGLVLIAGVLSAWFAVPDGPTLALADMGWAWRQRLAGACPETLDLMIRNRTWSRRGDRTAGSLFALLAAPSVLWAFLPGPRWRLGAVAIHAAAAMLAVVAVAILA